MRIVGILNIAKLLFALLSKHILDIEYLSTKLWSIQITKVNCLRIEVEPENLLMWKNSTRLALRWSLKVDHLEDGDFYWDSRRNLKKNLFCSLLLLTSLQVQSCLSFQSFTNNRFILFIYSLRGLRWKTFFDILKMKSRWQKIEKFQSRMKWDERNEFTFWRKCWSAR